MPSGSSVTYNAAAKLSASATGAVSNTATVTAPTGVSDPNNSDNSATDTDAVSLRCDLKGAVNDGRTTLSPGQTDTYTITVTNLGPSDVTVAPVSDNFPSAFTQISFTATQTGGASGFTPSGNGNINDTVTMPAGSKIIYKAKGTISSSATGSISDTTTVTAPSVITDPQPANNCARDSDTLSGH